jgi:hypothetical protein
MKMIFIEVLTIGTIIGFLIAFFFSLMIKWELVHRFDLEMRRKNSMTRFCFLCVAFWLSLALSLVYVAYCGTFRAEFIFMIPIGTMIGVHAKLPYQN